MFRIRMGFSIDIVVGQHAKLVLGKNLDVLLGI